MTRLSPNPSLLQRWTNFIRLALRDDDTDYTVGPTGRALGLLAIPMMLEMSMEAVFAVVDIAFVSRLGTDAIAAVGITEALVTVLYAVAIGLGMGITAMVSRRVGAKKVDEAASVTGQALWLGALLSVVIGVIGVIYAEDMLRMIGASAGVVETGAGYTAVLLGGSFSILYIFMLNAAFRGAGDAAVALRSLWIANGINIVLDPCFIFGLGPFPEMGVTGAAVATTIGRGTGVLYQLWYLLDGRGRLEFHLRHMRVDPALIKRMLVISVGGVGQFLIATSSWIIVMRIIALYGSNAIAAYTIALRMLEFVWLPAWGIGNAAATLVGQNLGANKPDRADKSAWQAVRFNFVFMTVVGSAMLIGAPIITGWFTSDPEVLRYGTTCLRVLSIGFPLYAIGMILTQALNGAGDTFTPSAMNLLCFWLIQIPLAYWLATQLGAGPNGVFIAIVLSESLLSVLSIIVFRRGRWKLQTA
ncbi:MAG: MATE family efflux transporter [Woeseiaceae bacterium]